MIVATAGHVDHGKSSLVAALTGQATDRLPEEQRRGLTIEPGYAHADLGGGAVVDFVDLPGHERYRHHLLAGVAAADLALLLVAADDGPMPQTHEHLALLRALQVPQLVAVLSKTDRVEPARRAEVHAAVQALLHRHGHGAAPVLEVCAPRGTGIEALRRLLRERGLALPARDAVGAFRLAVDRHFTRPGAGLVVTGTVLAGRVHGGDLLRLAPAGGAVRVRGVQVHGAAVAAAQAGQRCALNLVPQAGETIQVQRGDALLAPELLAPTRRIDVQWWPAADADADTSTPPPLPKDRQLHLHLAGTMRQARLVPLGGDGGTRFAQLLLDRPLSTLHGDRFVLRDPAAQRLLGGGSVLDAQPPVRGRQRPQRQADLQALACATPQAALARLLAVHPEGVEWAPWALNWNLPPAARAALADACGAIELPHAGGLRLISPAAWHRVQHAVLQALQRRHREHPASRGLTDAEWPQALAETLAPAAADSALGRAALAQARAAGHVVRDGFHWRLPGHTPQIDATDAALLQRVQTLMQPHGLRPPPLGELAALLALPLPEAARRLQHLAQGGHLVQIAKNRFFLPEALQALVQVARDTAAAAPDGWFEVIPFRDRSGIGRNLSIQVLEYFDRVRITRFVKERRTMVEGAPG